jgi:hypothetical protein
MARWYDITMFHTIGELAFGDAFVCLESGIVVFPLQCLILCE